MKRLLHLLALVVLLAGMSAVLPGCKSSSGSRDYLPGKGWVPND